MTNMITTYKANPGRIKNLNMNCTPEEGADIVRKFGEKAFEDFKKLDFSYPTFDQKMYINEYERLVKNPGTKNKGSSSIVRGFHKSMYLANKEKHMSPVDYWNRLKTDFEEFRKFYYNRLTRSDWFKEDDRMNTWARQGKVPDKIYFIGLTTSGIAPCVGYFKPKLTKYLIEKYARDFNTIFDPFSGYSGRMLGTIASGKEYIGQDLNKLVVDESNDILSFLKDHFQLPNVHVTNKDILESSGSYDCLLTCPPYSRKEEYPGNVIYKSCDEWIDECLSRFKCKMYIFIVDNTIQKYRDCIKDSVTNDSHWGSNSERILIIK